MKPVIGITMGPETIEAEYGTVHRYRVSRDYLDAIAQAGGLPVMLAPHVDDIDQVLEMADGIVFTGGADIEPARYGCSEIHPETYGISKERDTYELELIRSAINADMPLLCICRGIQVLNVALGGTIEQHLEDDQGSDAFHRQFKRKIDATQPGHRVATSADGLLRRITGEEALEVNSLHHQGLGDVADGLIVDAVSEDGVIEAVSAPGCEFALAVQWHPEMMFHEFSKQNMLFTGFVEAARSHHLAHTLSHT